ncbi:terminase small subunit [Anaerocolumna sp. AGMB13025]|uniref:terminase small subunit n=1 Tax=Anaerocolumna sp. AGMB13025 TaxID=3039116 RepID=UPI00241C5955|nr:terminase small subunit [Anaerocolumna sp. AGMB13025]WFR56396.1 terminase small subunit [Anaerocolumna sp. AGMB13025]
MALTDKQKLFADEYLIDLNATRAYKAVYKNCKNDETAAAAGARMLRNVKVAEYIQQRMKDREKRTEITQDKVLTELAAIAFSKGSDFAKVVDEPIISHGKYVIDPDTGKVKTFKSVEVIPTDKLTEEKKKAISGIKEGKYGIEVATCDKVKALELLGRHLGMFKDKVELTNLNEEKGKLDNVIAQLRGG